MSFVGHTTCVRAGFSKAAQATRGLCPVRLALLWNGASVDGWPPIRDGTVMSMVAVSVTSVWLQNGVVGHTLRVEAIQQQVQPFGS